MKTNRSESELINNINESLKDKTNVEIVSKLNTDKLFEELEEYEIEVSISIPSK